MPLVFVRHAQSVGNIMSRDERAQSPIPNHAYPLTEVGRQQSAVVGSYLANTFGPIYFQRVFDTDFLRSVTTLDIILEGLMPPAGGAPVRRTDSRLNEKWDGIFHEMTRKEIEQQYPEQVRLRERAGYHLYRAPGGENCPDVELRIRSFLHDYRELMESVNFLIVGHGRWFTIFQKIIHQWSAKEFMERKEAEDCENCSVTFYEDLSGGAPATCVPWQGELPHIKTTNA